MKVTKSPTSTLHLQMGQEVIYLLLVTSLIANLGLALVALKSVKNPSDPPSVPPPTAPPIPKPPVAEPEKQPPIITLREADGFSFSLGSADLSDNFTARIPDVVRRIAALSEIYNAQIVEIIGHTDGTNIRNSLRAKANLDDALGQYVEKGRTVTLFPFDNVGLGMSRAVSVARALRESGLPTNLDIQPLSAAYLIAPNDRTDPAVQRRSDASRRRIEIRIRRTNAN
jgi:outer membrane protein OmpA-like peptidoglycan-associated protein